MIFKFKMRNRVDSVCLGSKRNDDVLTDVLRSCSNKKPQKKLNQGFTLPKKKMPKNQLSAVHSTAATNHTILRSLFKSEMPKNNIKYNNDI